MLLIGILHIYLTSFTYHYLSQEEIYSEMFQLKSNIANPSAAAAAA